MKWSLLELNKYKDKPCEFSEMLDLKASLMRRDDQILDVSPVKVVGLLTVGNDEYLTHYRIDVIVTVPSSRSLTPVPLSLKIDVDEVFMTLEQFQNRKEQVPEEEIIILEKPTIDLNESVEDNILLSIPLQVLTEEEQHSHEMPQGNDWEVLSEEDYAKKKQAEAQQITDPRLAKLSELFNESSEDDDKQ
ncbi:DUF177 domain-containing protein [Erwinia sp. CPCC 100877]|nr:DUF177 domain-containing protein [Erwinia sp. CPCC 100877]